MRGCLKKYTVGFFSVWLTVGLCGCVSIRHLKKQSPSSIARVWAQQSEDIVVDRALATDDQIFLTYRAVHHDSNQEKTFYCHAQWNPEKYDNPDAYGSIAASLEFVEETAWERMIPEGAVPVTTLSVDEWRQVRASFVAQFGAAVRNGEGVLVQVDEQDTVFYRDATGKSEVASLIDKPAEIQIVRTYSRQETEEAFIAALQDFLARHELTGLKKILFAVNQDAGNFKPFIFIDLDKQLALMLEFKADTGTPLDREVTKGIRATDYAIVNSHILGMATRPFSYAFRLFAWSKDTVYDAVTTPAFVFNRENEKIPPLAQGQGMDLDAFDQWITQLSRRQPAKGEMRFLIGGEEFFRRLIEVIQGAKKTIDVRIFIFDNDDYAVKIADLLKQKSREGLRVRVLLDGMGQIMGEGKIPDDLPAGFVPPYSMPKYLIRNSNIQVRVRPDVLFRADHTKTITIDNKISFTGGMNIGREYRYDWHDMMVELEGPVLSEITYEFDMAWAHAGPWGDLGFALAKSWKNPKGRPSEGEGPAMRLLYTRVNSPELYRVQLEAIRRARKYIWINNAYFSDNEILYELIAARGRGVDVRVILPESGNHEIMNKSNIVTANILFRNGIKVYFYPGMSHIKAAIYDGWLCTGSANFDKLSLRDNLEMNVATADERTVEMLKHRLFEKDFSRSQVMTQPLKSNFMDIIAETVAEQL